MDPRNRNKLDDRVVKAPTHARRIFSWRRAMSSAS